MTSTSLQMAYLLADAGIVLSDSKKGCAVHARSMIRALEQEGCRVKTLVMRQGRKMQGYEALEAPHSGMTHLWRSEFNQKTFRKLLPSNAASAMDWWLLHRDFYRSAVRELRTNPAHFLYARHAWFSWPYARLKKNFGVPLVLEVNAVMSIEKKARGEEAFHALTKRIEREGFEAADLILPVSSEIRDQILSFGIDPSKLVVTPNAVDLELFAPVKEFSIGRTFTIGCVSSFRTYHGLTTLMHAAARLKDRIPGLRLMLIGNGPEFAAIRNLAADLGLQEATELTGVLDHDAVPRRLGSCEVCVCPNEGVQNQYNCPMKLFEYMALKVPVVASRWGDIPNIVEDGVTGLLHEPGDADDLARALLEVYEKPEEAKQRIENAYLSAQGRSWRANARFVLDSLSDSIPPVSPHGPDRIQSKIEIEGPVVEKRLLGKPDLLAKLSEESDGCLLLVHGAYLKDPAQATVYASASRILLDEGLQFFPVLFCEGNDEQAAEARLAFARQLGPHKGLLLPIPKLPATLVKMVAAWTLNKDAVSYSVEGKAYVETDNLADLVYQIRRFLLNHTGDRTAIDDAAMGWSGYFQELNTMFLPEDPADSGYRVLRPRNETFPVNGLVRLASGKPIVALAPSIGKGSPANLFLDCCRQLLDENRKFFVVVAASGLIERVSMLERAFHETFTSEEGQFYSVGECNRHILNKVAFGMAEKAPDGREQIVCRHIFRLLSNYQPALAWQIKRGLLEVDRSWISEPQVIAFP